MARFVVAVALLACVQAVPADITLAHFTFDEDAFVNAVDSPVLHFEQENILKDAQSWHRWLITIQGWCRIEEYKENNMAWHVVYGSAAVRAEGNCKIVTKNALSIPFYFDQCKFSLKVTDLDFKYYGKNVDQFWSVESDPEKENDDFMCFSVISNATNEIISGTQRCQHDDINRRRRLADDGATTYTYDRPDHDGTSAGHAEDQYGASPAYSDQIYYMDYHEFEAHENTAIIESPYIPYSALSDGIKIMIEGGTDHETEHWYADDMKIICTPRAPVNCEANEYYYGRVNDEGFCSHCAPGRYSAGCTDCEKSASVNGADICVIEGLTCPAGKFALSVEEVDGTEGHVCHSCPSGYYSAVDHGAECLGCSAGQYQDTEGSTSCTDCESGKYSETDMASECASCGVSAYSCNPGSKSVSTPGSKTSTACQCETCGVGTFQANGGALSCDQCAKGNYEENQGAAACKTCPRGYFAGAMGEMGCTMCPDGTHTDASAADSSAKCIAKNCPPGQHEFIPADTSLPTTCIDCPAGKYGGKDENDISRCMICGVVDIAGQAVGTYAHEAGMSACKPCPTASDSSHGTVPNAAKTSCTANWCHAGRYKYHHPQTNMDYCLPCQAGKYGVLDAGASGGVCKGCAGGKYTMQSAQTECTTCPVDYDSEPGATSCEHVPTKAPTATPTLAPTKAPTPPPTSYPTVPTPAPTPVHFMPGLAATVVLTNVTVQDFPAHQSTFETVIGQAFGCKQHPEEGAKCMLTDVHVDEVKSAHNNACDRVRFSGLAPGAMQADRMGDYYLTTQMYEGKPVYESSDGSNYLFWSHKGWVVGPHAGGRFAGLINPTVNAQSAEGLTGEWFTFVTNAEWLDGEWNKAPTLKMECVSQPKITVWFNIHNKDCSDAGKSKMDNFPQILTDLSGQRYHAQDTAGTTHGLLAHNFYNGGLMVTHLQTVYSTIVSCAPIIKLTLHNKFIHHKEQVHQTHLKSSCKVNKNSDIMVDERLTKSNDHVLVKGTSEAGVLSSPLADGAEPVAGTKYTLTLEGSGQVEEIDGKYLIKVGTMTSKCENRFVAEKGVWRCECLHYEPGEKYKKPATNPPTDSPTHGPTIHPTKYPTEFPTAQPTESPTISPTFATEPPTDSPTASPTKVQEGWAYKEWWHMDSTSN